MKNYFQSVEETAWPLKDIVAKEETPNTFDGRGPIAVKASLECGHVCYLTGEAISRSKIHCKPCGENNARAHGS